ncbi:helix-turn-helix transcriptional regulator [Caulobacter sp. 73W]|uniref:Helix-turn-helix transcriptional regulator n=1 Tax=Caulobacter sp. 73W TaxID=3161137 RepID=A0AB39KWZ7_9CAUL
MANEGDPEPTLAEIIKLSVGSLRRYRGMTRQQVADAMGVGIRTYDRFENGEGGFEFKRCVVFCRAIGGADPYALFFGVLAKDAHLALAAADNKMMLAIISLTLNLSARLREDVGLLKAQPIVSAATTMMDGLYAKAKERDVFSADWLEEHERRLRAYLEPDEPE